MNREDLITIITRAREFYLSPKQAADIILDAFESSVDEGTLKKFHDALGWQGGTIHDAVAEVARLKKLDSEARKPVGICRHDSMTKPIVICDDGTVWALDVGHWHQIAPIPGTKADNAPRPVDWDYAVMKDGNSWGAMKRGFINIQESDCAFGDTPIEALSELLGMDK